MNLELKTTNTFKILNKQSLGADVKRLDVKAEEIARRIQPGQFVMVTPAERSERIPLSVVDVDATRGTISLIFQEVGFTTKQLGALQINENVFNILGPLGVPPSIEKVGIIVCITTGMGAAQILPICRAHKKIGNKVIGIIGAKTKKNLVLESQLRLTCHKILIATNDGSYIKRGLATDLLRDLLKQETIHLVHAVGAVDLMEAVCTMTKERNIPTRVSLHPVMVDGTGMCGSCRVKVAGKTVLACVEGPEFDGHAVDFQDLRIRMKAFSVKKDEDGKELSWFNQTLPPSRLRSGPGIFQKFLWALPKSRP